MEMLKSEVSLLLLRNKQLESENLLLKRNELQLNQNLFNERQLNQVLENVKSAQNDYISKLNLLLIELTAEPDSANPNSYEKIRKDINKCVKICKQLQNEYELSKQMLNQFEDNTQKSLLQTNESFDSRPDSQTYVDQMVDNQSDNEDIPDGEEEEFLDEEEDDFPMPELDLIESPNVETHHTDDEDDDDPNGAGEQYLDINDKEFVPKPIFAKNARKSIPTNANRLELTPKKKRLEKRSYKTSQKFGDKFRCNWKGCCFISSYKQNVERHYRVHTGERPFKCQFKGCGFSASQAGNLKVHQQRHGHFTPNAHKIRVKSTHNAVKASPNAKNSK